MLFVLSDHMKIQELMFLHGAHTVACNSRVDKYFEGYYTLQFMEAGSVELSYEDDRYLMEGSWLWPAYPGPHIRFHVAPGHTTWNHRYIAFKGPLVNQWITEGLLPYEPQAVSNPSPVMACYDELLDRFRRLDRWNQFKAVNLLEGLLIDMAETRQESRTRETWLESVLEALAEVPGFTSNYEAIARQQHMSLSSLRRKFRQATGISIHRYQVQARISRARQWLGETDLSIKAIADKLGYPDVYFFSRQFKKETGTTPAVLRKSRQA